MLIDLDNGRPHVHHQAWVAPTAILAGAVTIAGRASVWFGVMMRADGDIIAIGEQSNIQDGSVIHAIPDSRSPLPNACLSGTVPGCTVARSVRAPSSGCALQS